MQSKLISVVLVCLSVLVTSWSRPGYTDELTPQQAARLEEELWRIIDRQPQYVCGGSQSEDQGLDCSGYIFLAARRACDGDPDNPFCKVHRTTAYNMALGLAGWNGINVQLHMARELDIPFWTWRDKPHHIHGHVGVYVRDRNGNPAVTHASQLRGRIIVEEPKGRLITDVSAIRRLTTGE